jgi:hypothetical protein
MKRDVIKIKVDLFVDKIPLSFMWKADSKRDPPSTFFLSFLFPGTLISCFWINPSSKSDLGSLTTFDRVDVNLSIRHVVSPIRRRTRCGGSGRTQEVIKKLNAMNRTERWIVQYSTILAAWCFSDWLIIEDEVKFFGGKIWSIAGSIVWL